MILFKPQYFFITIISFATATAKSLQSCPTLCNPIGGSLLGSPVPGILQARILEWVAISFSNAWKWKVKGKSLSCVRLLATPRTTAHQGPLSMGFSRQEYWSGVPLPSPIISSKVLQIHMFKSIFWTLWERGMDRQMGGVNSPQWETHPRLVHHPCASS